LLSHLDSEDEVGMQNRVTRGDQISLHWEHLFCLRGEAIDDPLRMDDHKAFTTNQRGHETERGRDRDRERQRERRDVE
jgi:hypothetical protein